MTAPPPLEIVGLSAGYWRNRVLEDVSLTVEPGEIFGLIGLNGAGKTTLIKTLLDLHPVRQGKIRLFGRDHGANRARCELAFLPELFSPSIYLRGQEFLALSQLSFGLAFDRAAANALAERLELAPAALPRRVTSYSKGMGQKLGLIAALLSERPLLVLDEPMSGLDPLARSRLKDALVDYRARGRSIFLSSHILADLDELCDRVAILHDGGLRFIGTPAALREASEGLSLERSFLKVIGA